MPLFIAVTKDTPKMIKLEDADGFEVPQIGIDCALTLEEFEAIGADDLMEMYLRPAIAALKRNVPSLYQQQASFGRDPA